MIIKSIELQNFRNYEDLNISFDEGTNILFGDNAQGKTNLTEAIWMLGRMLMSISNGKPKVCLN